MNLTAADGGDNVRPQIEVPLAELSGDFRNLPLDARDNRLLVRRTPGDQLRVRTGRRLAGLFARREAAAGGRALSLAGPGRHEAARCRRNCSPPGKIAELWSVEARPAGGPARGRSAGNPFAPPRRRRTTVLSRRCTPRAWPRSVSSALNWKRTIAERKVQLVVIDPQRPPPPGQSGELSQVIEIDSANPRWWDLKRKLPHCRG